ncbi:lanthionine synthetase C family protein [Nocardiopsis metallicus]|uniref:Lanthionine synthetase n=1 Tax=Nocardiopsis metallicus TaxID=179819 RepID=A0A840WCR9_9ACTN|nr:lanthionine synthetase C family protein [Nocardiopsis metallicus]MBB5494799.1 hypothetical protein [Nocardiopsis metallicus]
MTTRLTALLESLATPDTASAAPALCLATGHLGPALLHLMHDPDRAHPWIQAATSGGLTTDRATLFYGLPALAFVLSYAPEDRYTRDRALLTRHLTDLAHHRTRTAHQRIDQHRTPTYSEYDLISGLTGIGVALMRTAPHSTALEQVLTYLVRLTEPLPTDQGHKPGWWVHHDPRMINDPAFPHGHMNLGMAHGISGVLAFLSLNHRAGRHVPGQQGAIRRLCETLDLWQRSDTHGSWWPGWVTTPHPEQQPQPLNRPGPPSWCYGTPGIARARQLAGRALQDYTLQHTAEHALLACVQRANHQNSSNDDGLCHGSSGLLQTLLRATHDHATTTQANELAQATDEIQAALMKSPRSGEATDIGLLEGRTGTALVLSTRTGSHTPAWDTLLLLADEPHHAHEPAPIRARTSRA